MKISNIGNAYEVYAGGKASKAKNNDRKSKLKDTVNVSDSGKDFQVAFKAAATTSDVREDKVEFFKKQIDKGVYFVNSEAIADKIFANAGY